MSGLFSGFDLSFDKSNSLKMELDSLSIFNLFCLKINSSKRKIGFNFRA